MLLPLKLDIPRNELNTGGGSPPDSQDIKDISLSIFKRDHNQCRYCGMYSPTGGALEIDHQDGNHHNWDDENLVSACLWCHSCHHLEFSLKAGASLVQWDYPQAAISRLTQQTTLSTSLYENYNSLIQEGARRREHNYPSGEINVLVAELPRLRAKGNHHDANEILRMMDQENIRLTFPTHLYLSATQTIPGLKRDAWTQFRRYYISYVNETISDSDIRGKLLKAWKDIALK